MKRATVLMAFTMISGFSHGVQLLSNGSFEIVQPFLGSSSSDNFRYLANGDSTTLPGWTAEQSGSGESAYVYNFTRYTVANGANGLLINPNTGVRQSLFMNSGFQYRMSMWAGGLRPSMSGYGLNFYQISNGTEYLIGTYRPTFEGVLSFRTFSFDFIAQGQSGPDNAIVIRSSETQSSIKNIFLDGVVLEPVPEPATMTVLGLATAAMLRRRKA